MAENQMVEKEEMLRVFVDKFGAGGDVRGYFAPGRVNLIGEYTDFNGGYVFPCGLTMGTFLAARKRSDRKLRMYSMNFEQDGIIESSLDQDEQGQEGNWTKYPKGVIATFQKRGIKLHFGYDILVYGTIPHGSGLSSSASLEVVTGVMLRDMEEINSEDLTLVDVALIGQQAENEYVGVNCGIMDQFAVAMAKKDHAIFLDTNKLEYEYVPICLDNHQIVIVSSNKKRSLTDSKYNERRQECEQALALLQQKADITCLCDLTVEQFESIKEILTEDHLYRRAKHTVYENERTKQAVEALQKNDIEQFGRLMNESHRSLRYDYEVTGKELDVLVDAAMQCEGVVGSRMTGAGFGGCTVSIVRTDCVETFISRVGNSYQKAIGYQADFYVAGVGDGARIVSLMK